MSFKKTRQIGAGEFKAKCLKLMDEIGSSKTPLTVTKHGKPLVTIFPFEQGKPFPFGCMRDQTTIKGNIIDPIGEFWDADQD
ncbi:type II toxin-antitoxin system Phd/YefM family antitoxin [soil metagenome]